MNIALLTVLIYFKIEVKTHDVRLHRFNVRPLMRIPAKHRALQHRIATLLSQCNAKIATNECPVNPIESEKTANDFTNNDDTLEYLTPNVDDTNEFGRTAQIRTNIAQSFRRMIDQRIKSNMISLPLHGLLNGYHSKSTENLTSLATTGKINLKLDPVITENKTIEQPIEDIKTDNVTMNTSKENFESKTLLENSTIENLPIESVAEKFSKSLDNFERLFYFTTFNKLLSISPASRKENGMSYVQSGLFLHLALMALATEVDLETKQEINNCLKLDLSDQESLNLINTTMSSLPESSNDLKFRWSSRLVLRSQEVGDRFRSNAAPALRLKIDSFNGTETPRQMTDALNHMVEIDSGGAIHDTFEEEELSSEVRGVLVSTLYLRARWRSAPTLLNGSRPFRDAAAGPRRVARMIRVNDVMRYADLPHWDAEALEISYSTPGLSLLLLLPRGPSLRQLVAAVSATSFGDVTARMQPLRVAATLPLYTLRMTLLLPNKLEAMNISRLVGTDNNTTSQFRLSLAVQRIMFWAEAGRNAFKDDGLEWDEAPEREIVVDRPYIFYVRWKNNTIMNGNFVL